jgi:hypothetical protein
LAAPCAAVAETADAGAAAGTEAAGSAVAEHAVPEAAAEQAAEEADTDAAAQTAAEETAEGAAAEVFIPVPAAEHVTIPAEVPAETAARKTAEAKKPAARTIVVPSSAAKNIGTAMAAAKPGDTVKVMDGTYKEAVFVAPGVVFISNTPFKAVLDGRGRNTVVTMGTSSVISGFEIKNGAIGVFSASAQAVIRQCRIIQNIQSGIICVGALPRIEDNFIVYNKGSGIQGWDVRTTSGSINHNTIAFNANHGISLGGNTSITIENNIIAFNDQFGVKPGTETVRVMLVNNNFYQNARISSNLPADNMSADPLFVDAKRLNFNLMKESRSIGQGTDNQNLGARILH